MTTLRFTGGASVLNVQRTASPLAPLVVLPNLKLRGLLPLSQLMPALHVPPAVQRSEDVVSGVTLVPLVSVTLKPELSGLRRSSNSVSVEAKSTSTRQISFPDPSTTFTPSFFTVRLWGLAPV